MFTVDMHRSVIHGQKRLYGAFMALYGMLESCKNIVYISRVYVREMLYFAFWASFGVLCGEVLRMQINGLNRKIKRHIMG